MTNPVQCEKVTVRVYLGGIEDGGRLINVAALPAYSRSADNFRTHLTALLDTYMQLSATAGEQMSTADFTLWLLTQAASEPYEQEPVEYLPTEPGTLVTATSLDEDASAFGKSDAYAEIIDNKP